jgi:hypothetical protein
MAVRPLFEAAMSPTSSPSTLLFFFSVRTLLTCSQLVYPAQTRPTRRCCQSPPPISPRLPLRRYTTHLARLCAAPGRHDPAPFSDCFSLLY